MLITGANVHSHSDTDTNSIHNVSARFQAKCVIALVLSDEILQKLFQTTIVTSNIHERSSRGTTSSFCNPPGEDVASRLQTKKVSEKSAESSICNGGARTAFYFLQFPYLLLIPLSCKPPNLDEITRIGWFLKCRRFAVLVEIIQRLRSVTPT